MERVLGAASVRGRVRERADGLEQLDHRAGPAVGDDQRQRVLVGRLHVDKVDVDPVDLGPELRQRVEPCLATAPVVLVRPVPGERLIVASCTPWERSWTSSLLGRRVAARRRRSSSSASSGTSTWKGRIAVPPDLSVVTDISLLRWSVTPPTLARWAARRAREDPGPAALFWTGVLSGPPGTAGAARPRGRCGSRRRTTRRTAPAASAARRRPRRWSRRR